MEAEPGGSLDPGRRARREARLDQVVCTLEGMATLLQRTSGDFAVVIHGDADCANVLLQGMDHPGAERFFCSGISPEEAMAGRSLPVLRSCLEALVEEESPGVIFVLGTCLSALVGDEVERVVEAVASKLGATRGVVLTHISGAGMRLLTQAELLDRFGLLMMESAPPQEPRELWVNLLGFDPGAEVRAQLAELGITVNGVLTPGADVAEWQSLGRARHNLVLDRRLFHDLGKSCSGRGIDTVEVAWPVGLAGTDRFFAQVTEALGVAAAPGGALSEARSAALSSMSLARESLAGRRLGYNIGSKKNMDPRTLAMGGLTDLAAFEELDLETVLLVQGDDHPDRLAAVRETLAAMGCDAPVAVFSDTVFFSDLCLEQGVELVYASDHLRALAARAGVGFLDQGALMPGYGSVERNIRTILASLDRIRR